MFATLALEGQLMFTFVAHCKPLRCASGTSVLRVVSKNPKLYINDLNDALAVKQVVIDGSVPVWKAKLWKKDCDSLRLACHDVSEEGAFVMKMQ